MARCSMRLAFNSAGVLDDLYYYPGTLGVVFHAGNPTLSDFPDLENYAVKLKVSLGAHCTERIASHLRPCN